MPYTPCDQLSLHRLFDRNSSTGVARIIGQKPLARPHGFGSAWLWRALWIAILQIFLLIPGAAHAANTYNTLDGGAAAVGSYTDIAIGGDGFPVISYYDSSNGNLKFVKCGDALCTPAKNTVRTVDGTPGSVGTYTAIAVPADGKPVIAYFASAATSIVIAKCSDASCSSTSKNDVPAGVLGGHTSIAIGRDGFPVISYLDNRSNGGLSVIKCDNAQCSTGATYLLESGPYASEDTSIAIGSDGFPIIAYRASSNDFDLKVAKCVDVRCAKPATITRLDTVGSTGRYASIAIGLDGLPIIAHYDSTNMWLKVVKCGNASCTGTPTITKIDTTAGQYNSITVPADGLPIIAYYDEAYRDLRVAKCTNAACTNGGVATLENRGGQYGVTGRYTSIAIGKDGLPVIAYEDSNNQALSFVHCGDASCGSGTSTSSAVNQAISFGSAPAITVGGTGTVSATATSGLPVTYSSLTAGVCSVSGNTITGIAAGTCSIAANQAGNASYNAATQVTQNITIGVASQTSISDTRVFAFAEANFPSLFTVPATAGQYKQYNYRYYPASGNYLVIDSSGVIFVLGMFTGGALTTVGQVESIRSHITAWEAAQW